MNLPPARKTRFSFKRGSCSLPVVILIAAFSACSNPGRVEDKRGRDAVSAGEQKALVPFEGTIVFQSDMGGKNDIYLLTAESLTKLTGDAWSGEYPRWSSDGKWIAFSSKRSGNYDVCVMAEDGTRLRQVTSGSRDKSELAWFPDGRRIAYTEETKRPLGKSYNLWEVEPATGRTSRIMPDFPGSNALPAFSPVAPLLAFTGKKTVGWDVYLFDLDKKQDRNLTENGKTCRPAFSPDGTKIAYVSHEADGKGDVWVMDSDGSGKTRLTERDATYDYYPAWSPDGRFVVFCSNEKSMYAEKGDWDLYLVEVKTKRVTLLFSGPGRDVFPDWKR